MQFKILQLDLQNILNIMLEIKFIYYHKNAKLVPSVPNH